MPESVGCTTYIFRSPLLEGGVSSSHPMLPNLSRALEARGACLATLTQESFASSTSTHATREALKGVARVAENQIKYLGTEDLPRRA